MPTVAIMLVPLQLVKKEFLMEISYYVCQDE
jgi:hypothetical protein